MGRRVLYEVRGLTKRYRRGNVLANDGITVDIYEGEILGIFGPNGAGKTTFVRQLAGLLRPSSGSILLGGRNIVEFPDLVSKTVSTVGQRVPVFRYYRAAEVLLHARVLRGLPLRVAENLAKELLERFDLLDQASKRFSRLSGGQQRVLTLLTAFMGEPRGVLLDEPTSNLDPRNRRRVWAFLEEMRRERGLTVVVTSHILAEAEGYLDQVMFIDRGRAVALGTPVELKRLVSRRMVVEVRVKEGAAPKAEAFLNRIQEKERKTPLLWVFRPRADELGRLLEAAASLAREGLVDEVKVVSPTMDDVYIHLTEQASSQLGGKR